jgi:putative transposase
MLKAHKIALNPNNKQKTYFAQASGTARFAYNWALAEWKKQYEAHLKDACFPKPSETSLRRQLNAIKRSQFPWMLNVTKNAPQIAIIQLGTAFKNFIKGTAKYPQYRKKGVHDRFSLTNDQFQVDGSRIRIPNLGWVCMRETLRFTGKIMSATISRVADRWFVSITVDHQDRPPLPLAENQGVVGVDLGLSVLATLSTGERIIGPKAHKTSLKQLKRSSRALSRKQKGSKNRQKAKMRVARLHAKISCLRQESLHQLTTDLTRRFHTIVIEDLNVKGMMQNRHLSRAIADMGFYEFRRQLEYKAMLRGNHLVIASPWFASSKMCSCCGHTLACLSLSLRKWECPKCNTLHDRDLNAAINLKNLAVSSTVTVCGEEGSGLDRKSKVKPASMKQKFNTIATYG